VVVGGDGGWMGWGISAGVLMKVGGVIEAARVRGGRLLVYVGIIGRLEVEVGGSGWEVYVEVEEIRMLRVVSCTSLQSA